jgi:very-short-patch-repair endonuclease
MSQIVSQNNFSFDKKSLNTFLFDTEIWFIAKEISDILNYSETSKMLRRLDDDEKRTITRQNNLLPGYLFKNQGSLKLIKEQGVAKALSRSQKITTKEKQELFDFFQSKGLLTGLVFYSRAEVEFISELEEFLKTLNVISIKQFQVLNFKVDLYLPELKIAIEFDENDHRNYDVKKEKERQDFIKEILGCDFLRLSDKDSCGMNIGKVLKFLE